MRIPEVETPFDASPSSSPGSGSGSGSRSGASSEYVDLSSSESDTSRVILSADRLNKMINGLKLERDQRLDDSCKCLLLSPTSETCTEDTQQRRVSLPLLAQARLRCKFPVICRLKSSGSLVIRSTHPLSLHQVCLPLHRPLAPA